jgi:hypothetical protein
MKSWRGMKYPHALHTCPCQFIGWAHTQYPPEKILGEINMKNLNKMALMAQHPKHSRQHAPTGAAAGPQSVTKYEQL